MWCSGLPSLTAGGPGNWAPPSPAPPTGPKLNPFLRGPSTDSNATAGSSSGPAGGSSLPAGPLPGPPNQVEVWYFNSCSNHTACQGTAHVVGVFCHTLCSPADV